MTFDVNFVNPLSSQYLTILEEIGELTLLLQHLGHGTPVFTASFEGPGQAGHRCLEFVTTRSTILIVSRSTATYAVFLWFNVFLNTHFDSW